MEINLIDPIEKPLNRDTPIYRYLEISTLYKMLGTQSMMLRRVTTFEDPWEVAIIRQKWPDPNRQSEYMKAIEKFYVSCWSRKSQEDSDALWRIYSHDAKGVCIETTVEQLGVGLDPCSTDADSIAAIGPIVYEDQYNFILNNQFGRKHYNDYGCMLWAYNKRPAFSHEDEVRLTVLFKDLCSDDLIFIKNVDYQKLIKKIWMDPRAEEWYVEAIAGYLKTKYGIPCEKSPLYKADDFRVNGATSK